MDSMLFSRLRLRMTLAVSAAIWSLLVWQHVHGGVPSHSFLARSDMPSISNWWGAVSLPAATWFLTGRVAKRLYAQSSDGMTANAEWRTIQLGYAGALLYAVALAFAYTTGRNEIASLLFQSLPFIGLLLPIFRAECVLGFVLGLTYTFGAVLPLFIATIISAAGAVLYLLPRAVVRRIREA